MATLASLKLTSAAKPTNVPAIQVRHNKQGKRLWEQAEPVKAQPAGANQNGSIERGSGSSD